MTHLVIVSFPRSGSHMVASMIECERDIGCPHIETENRSGSEWGEPEPFYREQDRDGLVISQLKILFSPLERFYFMDGAVKAGAKLLILGRRDVLAAYCSNELVISHGRGWVTKSPEGHQITVDKEQAAWVIETWRDGIVEALSRYPDAAWLFYEDVTVDTVRWALDRLGISANVTEPTTEKLSPPLADYVTNFDELRAAFPAPPPYPWET